jgi:hypothetical protein
VSTRLAQIKVLGSKLALPKSVNGIYKKKNLKIFFKKKTPKTRAALLSMKHPTKLVHIKPRVH